MNASCIHWGEGTHRLLKNHTDLATPDGTDGPTIRFSLGEIEDIIQGRITILGAATMIDDLTVADFARFGNHVENGAGRHRFTATTLTDHAQCFSAIDSHRETIYGFDDASTHIELDAQVFYFE